MSLLAMHEIDLLADIRGVPRSRRHPHFQQAALEQTLREHGVAYVHLRRLGGSRRPVPDSLNAGWSNRSFRGYADYAMGEEFAAGLAELRSWQRGGARLRCVRRRRGGAAIGASSPTGSS